GRYPDLPGLAEDAPEELASLRQVWESEREKIRADLDDKLAQSLQALEGDLTRERRLEEAQAVLVYREALASAVASDPTDPTDPAPAAAGSATDNPLRATVEQPFENSLGMKFVPVPGTD